MSLGIATEYTIEQATLYADRTFPNGSVDIRGMIIELSFFESLDKLHYSGQMVVIDDLGIFDEIELQGTERLIVDVKGGDLHGTREALTVEANIVSIYSVYKQGDKQEVYAINFIAPYMFDDEMKKISKSYTGRLEVIAKNILKNELDVEMLEEHSERQYNLVDAMQDDVRVITPYISPTESVKWILDRATTDKGSPYFCWGSIWSPQATKAVYLGNFDTMVEEGIAKAKKKNRNFNYTMMGVNLGDRSSMQSGEVGRDTTDKDFTIVGVNFTKLEDTLKMVREGAVGSMLQSLDTFTTQKYERHLNIGDILDNFEDEILDFSYDPEFALDTNFESMGEQNARYRNLVTSYGTYNTINSYHDVFNQVDALNKVRPIAIKSAMYRNMIEATFKGIEFWEEEYFPGDVIGVEFFTASTFDEDANKISLRRSGYYMIHDIRHMFKDGQHIVSTNLCKVRDLDDKPTYEGGMS